MDKKLNDKLFEKHKNLLTLNQTLDRVPILRYKFEFKNGWYKLVDELLEEIEKIIQPDDELFSVFQIKEKFAGLRFYVENGNEEINELINQAEAKSYSICEFCGSEDNINIRKSSWWVASCDTCFNKTIADDKTS